MRFFSRTMIDLDPGKSILIPANDLMVFFDFFFIVLASQRKCHEFTKKAMVSEESLPLFLEKQSIGIKPLLLRETMLFSEAILSQKQGMIFLLKLFVFFYSPPFHLYAHTIFILFSPNSCRICTDRLIDACMKCLEADREI